ncbi:MAG: amidohydrolase [Candidatus Limnocylindrales bacterium]
MTKPPDLVVTGRIATLTGDTGFGWMPAIALTNGRVSATGPAAEIARSAGSATRMWRLPDGLCVMPGITDAHLHLGMAARAATALDLGGARDRGAILERIAAAHRALADAGDTITPVEGQGWSVDSFGGWPSTDDLDRAAPGRTVSLWSHDHHARWVSRDLLGAAVSRAGASASLIRREADGGPTGILHEAATSLVDPLLPAWDAFRRRAALAAYARTLTSLGVTGVHDPGELADAAGLDVGPALYRGLAREGRLALRVTASVREPQLPAALDTGMRTGAGEGRYRDGWLKLFADGALGSRSAALLAPWAADDPAGPPVGDPTGLLTASPAELLAAASRAVTGGIAVQVHGIGDRAVRVVLDVLAGLPRVAGVRHRVEHAQLVDAADIPRFATLDVAASVQPCHLCTDEPAMRVAWGTRAANAFPLASLDAGGALIPLGTDAPVESPDPWRNLAAAVSRSDPGWPEGKEPFHAEQALPVDRAIRAACLDPAITAGRDDHGRLVPGAVADLVVVPVEGLLDPGERGSRLAGTRPLAVLIDGDVVHLAPGYDPDA